MIYHAMISRTTRATDRGFRHYGGAGKFVCDRWTESFENFLADMGERPSKDATLDRIDNRLGYSPENCRWATWEEQAENKSNSRLWITPLGTFPSSRKAAIAHGVGISAIRHRCGTLGYPAREGYGSVLKYPDD